MKERLYRFFVRDDAEYDTLLWQYQAKTLLGKFFYLFMHVLPGLLAYVLINIPLVHAAALRFTGLSDPMFQGTCLIGVVFVWHAVVPVAVLRWADGLSFQESLAFLSLRKFDTRGFYPRSSHRVYGIHCGFPALHEVHISTAHGRVASIPGLNPPEYSIFRNPSGVYSLLPAWLVGLGLIGNFLCEELYFHGYLMKKIAFWWSKRRCSLCITCGRLRRPGRCSAWFSSLVC